MMSVCDEMSTVADPRVAEVAAKLVELCRAQNFDGALNTLYAEDAVHVEVMPMPGQLAETRGKDALLAASKVWVERNEVHDFDVSEPLLSRSEFAVRMTLDVTSQDMGGQRVVMEELCVYSVNDGKISKVRFFYQGA